MIEVMEALGLAELVDHRRALGRRRFRHPRRDGRSEPRSVATDLADARRPCATGERVGQLPQSDDLGPKPARPASAAGELGPAPAHCRPEPATRTCGSRATLHSTTEGTRGTSSSASSRPAPHGAPTSPPAGGRWRRFRPEATLAWAGRTRLDRGENPKRSLAAPAALPSSSDEGSSEEPGCSFGRARRAGSGPRRSTPAAAIQKHTPIAPTRHQSCRLLVERGR
jgi:hypothetical protein